MLPTLGFYHLNQGTRGRLLVTGSVCTGCAGNDSNITGMSSNCGLKRRHVVKSLIRIPELLGTPLVVCQNPATTPRPPQIATGTSHGARIPCSGAGGYKNLKSVALPTFRHGALQDSQLIPDPRPSPKELPRPGTTSSQLMTWANVAMDTRHTIR